MIFLNVYLKKAGKTIFYTNCIQNIMMLHFEGDCIFFKEQVLIKWRNFFIIGLFRFRFTPLQHIVDI